MTGQSEERVDAYAKVTGQARYALDMAVPGMLHGHLVRSSRAHATIRSINVAPALATEGVGRGHHSRRPCRPLARYGHIVADHPILAIDKVRYYGEPVVLIVADNPYAASDGAAQVGFDTPTCQ